MRPPRCLRWGPRLLSEGGKGSCAEPLPLLMLLLLVLPEFALPLVRRPMTSVRSAALQTWLTTSRRVTSIPAGAPQIVTTPLIRTDGRKTNAGHVIPALARSDERHARPGALIKGRAARYSVSRCPPWPHLDYFGPLRNSAQARRRRCSPRVVTRVEARPSVARAPRDVQVSSWRPAPLSTADLPRSTA